MVFLNNPTIRGDMEEIYQRTKAWCDFHNSVVLVTGAYGMIASYITGYLIWLNEVHHANITIVAAVRNEAKARARFGEALDREYFHLYKRELDDSFEWNGNIDYIIHAAGVANPKLYGVCPVDVAGTNVLGTYQLLKWASRHPVKGFLLFSTGDIYGMVDNPDNICEDTVGRLNPLTIHSCYGESKRMAETWCMCFQRQYGVRTMIARIAHTFSPFVNLGNDPRVFAAFVDCAVRGKDIVILSDGKAKRPFCYITDAIVGYLLILMKGEAGEAYNVSNSDGFCSISEIAEIIAATANPPVGIEIKGKREDGYVENRDNKANRLNEDKLLALGWEHCVPIDEGFRRVMKYVKTSTISEG